MSHIQRRTIIDTHKKSIDTFSELVATAQLAVSQSFNIVLVEEPDLEEAGALLRSAKKKLHDATSFLSDFSGAFIEDVPVGCMEQCLVKGVIGNVSFTEQLAEMYRGDYGFLMEVQRIIWCKDLHTGGFAGISDSLFRSLQAATEKLVPFPDCPYGIQCFLLGDRGEELIEWFGIIELNMKELTKWTTVYLLVLQYLNPKLATHEFVHRTSAERL
jgi:hypothetical protein